MRPRTLLGAATTCALLATPAAAPGAKLDRSDYVGHRLPVKVDQALFYDKVPGSFTGSLQRGQSFKVDRLSASGTYAYGFAYGGVNRHVYLKTAGLDASAPGPPAEPQLTGTPSVRYTFERQEGLGRYLSLAAVLRTDRALPRPTFGVIAAPTLPKGLDLPDRLFGGLTPATIGRASGHCYVTEHTQLRQRGALDRDRTWRVGLFRRGYVSQGRLKHVTLKHAPKSTSWQRRAAERLGC